MLWPIPLRYGCHHARHHGADPRLRVCERRAQGITDWLFELRVRRREVEKGSDVIFRVMGRLSTGVMPILKYSNTTPFLWPIHTSEHDDWRTTMAGRASFQTKKKGKEEAEKGRRKKKKRMNE